MVGANNITELSSGRNRLHDTVAWVFAAGPVSTESLHRTVEGLPRAAIVIAANGGSALVWELGMTPDLVVGDLDSADLDMVKAWEAQQVRVERYSHQTKLETDTELAVFAALNLGADRIYVIGATGGRADHSLANIFLLTHPQLVESDIRLVADNQEIRLAKCGRWNGIEGEIGDTVSLLPLGMPAMGVSTEGLEFPLMREDLGEGRGRGVSNKIDSTPCRVWLDSGLLLIVHIGPDLQF